MLTRRDRAVVGLLVVLLVALAGFLALPSVPLVEQASPGASGEPTVAPTPELVVYREGVVGTPESITPLTARTRADRTLVGLLFRGLVRPGPNGTWEPDLAEAWKVDTTGTVWTFTIRADATWHDGAPVTADDVVFTVEALKSPASGGGRGAAWAEITATALGSRTVRFTLATPITGFLAAVALPLLPAHLLGEVPFADIAASDFAQLPVGTGPFSLTEIDATRAVLQPVVPVDLPAEEATPGMTPDSLATPYPAASPARPMPYLERIEIVFYKDDAALAAALETGEVDGAAGLGPTESAALAASPGLDRRLYPTTTLMAVMLNLRPLYPELRSAPVRRALLAAIDRDALVAGPLAGDAVRADALVPAASWAFDPTAAPPVAYDRKAAAKALADAGWKKADGSWTAPGGKTPYAIELLTVSAAVNPELALVTTAVRKSWTSFGIAVTVKELPAAELAARLRAGEYAVAVVPISMGLEPDLFTLLASSQVRATGTNLSGYQDPALDTLLEAARKPGSQEDRTAAWKALLAGLDARLPLLPIAWSGDAFYSHGLKGPAIRLLVDAGDRFGDVLAWRLAANR